MESPTTSLYPITDILNWDYSGQLILTPYFQRREVWQTKAKSYLIDSIIRSMPIPPIFIRIRVDPKKQKTIREVIDGQQRLKAVLGFVRGDYPINPIHNKEFGGMYYSDLPENVQTAFLGYKFIISTFQDIEDTDVLSIFTRINTYTVTLNPQEKRNAKFFGAFKTSVYNISIKYLAFWRNSAILTEQNIARMEDAELVSILIKTMIDGINQTNDKDLNGIYEKYDDEFPHSEQTTTQFEDVINIIGNTFGVELKNSNFRRKPLLYSLFIMIFDAVYGLQGSDYPRVNFTSKLNRRLFHKLSELDNILSQKNPPMKYSEFIQATNKATANIGNRRLRHKFLWENVLLEII